MKNSTSTNQPIPPPPPSATPQKSRRTLLLVLILVVVIAIVAIVAATAFLNNNPNQQNNTPLTNSSPTPTGSQPTTNPTSPGQTNGNPIAGASSLSFKVLYTSSSGESYGYTWSAKNLGTENMMMRIDGTFTAEETNHVVYIINGVTKNAWMNVGDQWVDLTEGYLDIWSEWNDTWQDYYTEFNEWAGTGEYTYSVSGNTVRLYDIQINPTLDDSLFSH